jgi:hypothetical protein
VNAARLGLEDRPAARQEELARDRLHRDHIGVESEHEGSVREGRSVELDDLLALPGAILPRTSEATEGGEILVLPDDAEGQAGPPREVRPDEVCLLCACDDEQLVEEPRCGEVLE